MDTIILRTELLASFQALQDRFKNTLAWAQGRESEFGRLRQRFVTHMSEHLDRARREMPEGSPIHDQVIGFIGVMEATQDEWDAKVLGREKGVTFESTFGDSLLVFVNGKVKSGKSSLGNYMAWGNTDPTPALKDGMSAEQVPEYFSGERTGVRGGDVDGEAASQCEFRVDGVEATSSIQAFTLPGLTWADSPGLHSANRENGELARRYVEHADLILYTMKSDSPGRESDLAEISGLFRKEKHALLLLTGSDTTDDEVLDDQSIVTTVVMKDAADREKQRSYVRGALEKFCGAEVAANVHILSISAHYAQLHPDDPVRFADSGIGELFATLYRVAQDEGVALKARTPLTNLRHFLEGCRADLQPYQALLAGFRDPLRELRRDSDKRLGTVVHEAQRELQGFIEDYFETIEAGREAGDRQAGLAAFQQALDGQFREIASRHLASVFEDIVSGFATAVHDTYQSSEFVRLPDFELQKVTEKIPQVRNGTRKRNSLFGSILGGAIGLLGGLPGVAAGMSIGGALGGATGDSATTTYREIEVTVGDNLQQIRLQALRDGQQALDRQVRSAAAELWHSVERDVEQLLGRLEGEVKRFDTDLQELLQVVKQKLENA
jgi:hypothetical protein